MTIRSPKAVNPWRFFALALGISWFFWMWIILFNWNVFTFPAILFGALGLFGPAIAEFILISHTHSKEEWHSYEMELIDLYFMGLIEPNQED
jgi:hypothetical protein